MPPLAINLHDQNPPDYAAACYAARCQSIMNDLNLTEPEATAYLVTLWRETNAFNCADWDTQVAAENLLEIQWQDQRRAEAAELQIRQEEECEQARQDKQKKNHIKFLPYADVPMSATAPVLLSPLVLCKLHKGEFCKLYFFTNKGLEDARATSHSTDDKAFRSYTTSKCAAKGI
jgi:hypothetical protein